MGDVGRKSDRKLNGETCTEVLANLLRPLMYVPKMLNGWKRIGIILSVFWILVAYGVTYMSTLDLGVRGANEEAALIAFFPVPLALGVRLPHFVSCAVG